VRLAYANVVVTVSQAHGGFPCIMLAHLQLILFIAPMFGGLLARVSTGVFAMEIT